MSRQKKAISDCSQLKEGLRTAIDVLPRVQLAYLPTPLEEAPRLSKVLGGPRILFKRDDLTGLPLSGNKTRMFEFSLAEAIDQGAEIVVQSNAAQSNYSRQLAVACAKLGLQAQLVLRKARGEKDLSLQGNLLLDLLAGAKVELVDADVSEQPKLKKHKVDELRKKGHKVYEARGTDRDTAIEAVAYVNCALELYEQLEKMKSEPTYLFVSAHDTTQAGLLVGAKYLGASFQVRGINMFNHDSRELISKIGNDIISLLGLDMSISANEVINTADYVGKGYGIPTQEGLEAIKLVARSEGIFLDPVYTSKAMVGLIDHINQGRIGKDETVVFLHTGGFPSLFAYNKELEAAMDEKPVIR